MCFPSCFMISTAEIGVVEVRRQTKKRPFSLVGTRSSSCNQDSIVPTCGSEWWSFVNLNLMALSSSSFFKISLLHLLYCDNLLSFDSFMFVFLPCRIVFIFLQFFSALANSIALYIPVWVVWYGPWTNWPKSWVSVCKNSMSKWKPRPWTMSLSSPSWVCSTKFYKKRCMMPSMPWPIQCDKLRRMCTMCCDRNCQRWSWMPCLKPRTNWRWRSRMPWPKPCRDMDIKSYKHSLPTLNQISVSRYV